MDFSRFTREKGTKLEDIHTIISHPQALGQCSHFLEKLEGVELRSFDNTARAAQLVAASDDPGVAAIAAPQCADLYNLSPLMRNIQNSDNNYTRFICISKDFHVYPGANKISVVTTAKPCSRWSWYIAYQVCKYRRKSYQTRVSPDRRP